MGQWGMTIIDHANIRSTCRFPIADVEGVSWLSMASALTQLESGIYAITDGSKVNERWVGKRAIGSTAPPEDQQAQRELKWLCSYTDTVNGRTYTVEIGTADNEQLDAGTEYLALDAGNGLAFKTAFEAFVYSPAGHTVTLNTVKLVGRNI